MILQRFATPESIARFLRTTGIKGIRRNPTNDPFALYVKRLYPNASQIQSGTGSIVVWLNASVEHPVFFEIENTEAMNLFIEEFDEGMFPQLVRM